MEINAETLQQFFEDLYTTDPRDTEFYGQVCRALAGAPDTKFLVAPLPGDPETVYFGFTYGFELGTRYAEYQLAATGPEGATYTITPLGRAVLAAYEAQLEKEKEVSQPEGYHEFS